MHSASTRFNGITLFTFSVLGVLCLMNFAQGYFEFRPNAEVELQIESITNFVRQPKWDQASFKYSLRASTLPNTQICRRCTPGTSNNCSSTSKASGPIPSPTYNPSHSAHLQNDPHRLPARTAPGPSQQNPAAVALDDRGLEPENGLPSPRRVSQSSRGYFKTQPQRGVHAHCWFFL